MPKKLLILFSIFFLSIPGFASYVFVGNGGEGYESEGVLYTRDLFSYQVHKNPYIGNTQDQMLKAPISSIIGLELSVEEQNLLNKKITDINEIFPSLGDNILLAIQYFRWNFTEEPLGLINPDPSRIAVDPTKRVAIANRYLQNILLNKSAFNRLDHENKIALIIHEAVYALIRVQRHNQIGYQNLETARQITAGFFDKEALRSDSFRALILELLNASLERATFQGIGVRAFDHKTIRIQFNKGYGSPFDPKDSITLQIEQIDSPKVIARSLCTSYFKNNDYLAGIEVGPSVPAKVATTPYQTRENIYHFGLYIQPAQSFFTPVFSRDVGLCEELLTTGFDKVILSRRALTVPGTQ